MPNIKAIAPKKAANNDTLEFIKSLWDAFIENYDAFKAGKMSLKDEVKYQLLSSPGPAQYKAFSDFFDMFENAKDYLWSLKDQMYMHDFADIKDGTRKPDILELLEKLYTVNDYDPKEISLVSGLFWGQHPETREAIMSYFKKFHKKGNRIRLLTRAKIENPGSLFTDDSQLYMVKRKPFHFLMAGDTYLYFEFPHTESTVFRLNMLLDLENLNYKPGKSKKDMLHFLHSQFNKAS